MKLLTKTLVLSLTLAGAMLLLFRCHSDSGPSGVSLPFLGNVLDGKSYSLLLTVTDSTFRRTGGCATVNCGIVGETVVYDGCIFNGVGDQISATITVRQNGSTAKIEYLDESRNPAKTNTLSTELDQCWTYAGCREPRAENLLTPCFNDFAVNGILEDLGDGRFRFTGSTTQRNPDVAYTEKKVWFTSDFGWEDRIMVTFDIELTVDDISGTFLYEDRDPDRTTTSSCLYTCPISGAYRNRLISEKGWGYITEYVFRSDTDNYYDFMPYCNSAYLTGKDMPFYFEDGSSRNTCDYATCPPWVPGVPGLRDYPFCAWAKDLPCNVGGVKEIHCASLLDVHPDLQSSNPALPYDTAGVLCSDNLGAASQTRCLSLAAWCCDGAQDETSWMHCLLRGIRPLAYYPYNTYYTGGAVTALDYRCPITNPLPARGRNAMIPYDCENSQNYAVNCTADDVHIQLSVDGAVQ